MMEFDGMIGLGKVKENSITKKRNKY